MNRIVRFDHHGGLDALRILDEAPRPVACGEVLLRIHAFALNPSDALIRSGRFFERPALPSRVGYDAAGVVTAIGDGVEGVQVGDRVFTLPAFLQGPHGVQGSWAIVPARALVPLPATVDFAEGAALGVQYTTAYFALCELAGIRKGDWVYATAAAGNTGLAAVQVAHASGAQVVAVARSAAERARLQVAGVDRVIDDGSDAEVGQAILAVSGGGTPAEIAALDRTRTFFAGALGAGALQPQLGARFPLEQVLAAYAHAEGPEARGKTIVVC
jgi:NADPH:quinone reductase-like Zn-dependent oxidoreductase